MASTELRIGLWGEPDALLTSTQARERLKIADQLGYDSVWFDDANGFDEVTLLGEAVRATERMKIGTAIMGVFSRSPTVIAQTFASLDILSHGRMVIGLGASSAEFVRRVHGVTSFHRPLRRLREYVEIINLLVRGERLVYHGDLLDLESPYRLPYTPARNHIPIYIGANRPRSVEQTGEIADGIVTGGVRTVDEYSILRGQLAVGAARVARSAGDITVAVPIGVVYDDDESRRRQLVQQHKLEFARVIVGPWAIEEQKERLAQDFPEEVQAVEVAWARRADDPAEAMRAAFAAVTDEMVESRTMVTARTPSEIHKALIQLQSQGIDLPVLRMPTGTPDEAGRILDALING